MVNIKNVKDIIMLDINKLLLACKETMEEYSKNPQSYIAKQRREKEFKQIVANALFPYTMQSKFSTDMQTLNIAFTPKFTPKSVDYITITLTMDKEGLQVD
jgi:hypothetical protein